MLRIRYQRVIPLPDPFGYLLSVRLVFQRYVEDPTKWSRSQMMIGPPPQAFRPSIASPSVGGSVIVTGDANIVVDPRGQVIERDISVPERKPKQVLSETQAFERIGAAARLNLDQFERNLAQARSESNQFFKCTLAFSSFGFAVVLAGVTLLLLGQATAGVVSSIASLIPEVTAGLFFRKDRELRDVIAIYHQHILESQRLLTMIDVAETVKDSKEKDRIKQEIIFNVLSIDISLPNQHV
jgi:Cyanobacterial TRADD-N associated 2-Transmembrane domain